MEKNIRLLITGGHLTPALAVINWLRKNQPQVEIHFVGRLYSQSGKKQLSRERREIKDRDLNFYPFDPPKFATGDLLEKLFFLPKFLLSLINARQIIQRIKPNLVLTFGGYIAVPIAWQARAKHIPTITHEQTLVLGLANHCLAKFVNRVAVSYQQTLKELKPGIGEVTGNPIRQQIFEPSARPTWLSDQNLPLIYVSGGRLGSRIINQTISNLLPQLLKRYQLVHQIGPVTSKQNFQLEINQQVGQLPKKLQARYVVREWLEPAELAWIYPNCLGVVGRAGANTTSELLATGTPSLLIPLPFAYRNEQLLNAKMLAEKSLAMILQQKDLTPERLFETLKVFENRAPEMRKQLSQPVENNAPAKIWSICQQLVKKEHGFSL